jgi:hypothetical protein
MLSNRITSHLLALALLASPLAWAQPKEDAPTLLRRHDAERTHKQDVKIQLAFNINAGDQVHQWELVSYHQAVGDNALVLVTKPRTSQGDGYLRLDKNLWYYVSKFGKWERRTVRDRIGGFNIRASDLMGEKLSELYDVQDGGTEKIGDFQTRKLVLTAKENAEVAVSKLSLWLDEQARMVKRQDFTASGKLFRTSYYTRYTRVGEGAKAMWLPVELRYFDELDKSIRLVGVMRSYDLNPHPDNLFTKAWLETRSR